MNFFQRLKAVYSKTAFEKYVRSFVEGNDLSDFLGGTTEEIALNYSAFFACNRVLAETFASVSINEFKKLKTGDREETDETGLLGFLKYQPNDETSRFDFQQCMMYQINLGGNFVAERLMNGRKIVGLSQIPYESYDIIRGQEDRKLKYRIKGQSEQVLLNRDQVLHIPGPSVDGYTGMSLLSYGADTVRLGDTYNKFGQKFYDKGAMPSGVFEYEGKLKEESFKNLKKQVKENYAGMANAGTPMLLEDGLTYKPHTINPVDAELLSSRKFQVEEICRIFRVQPHLIQHMEKSTNNNIEHQSLEFVMYTMLPHFKRAEDNINSQLLTPRQRSQGYYMEYNMATLLRGDQKSMAEAFASGIQWGYYNINDVRRLLNLNKVNGGDVHLQPLNMVPLGTVPEDKAPDKAAQDAVNKAMDEATKLGNI